MPECTKAERDLLEATLKVREHYTPANVCRKDEAMGAVLAERRAAEQVAANEEASKPFTLTRRTHEESAQYFAQKLLEAQARIAELESALAEERAKPKEGAVRYVAAEFGVPDLPSVFAVFRERSDWVRRERAHAEFTGPDAERHAREYAARLQAAHDAKAGQP